MIDPTCFRDLFRTLMADQLLAGGAAKMLDEEQLRALLATNERRLPMSFRRGYVEPLRHNAVTVIEELGASEGAEDQIETIFGAVYQHSDTGLQPYLRRFLAVISNLYRSFLDGSKRGSLGIELSETLPPLASFQTNPQNGPYTITCDTVAKLFGADVGVVSLPRTFAVHPLLYGSLAHETGGHDVIHADLTLLPQLRSQAYDLFAGPDAHWLGMLWDYWMDEAAADVYGVLNMGPYFGYNLALLLSVFIAQGLAAGRPSNSNSPPTLRCQSGSASDGSLDVHPTDILRLALVQGAVESLIRLNVSARQAHSRDLSHLSTLLSAGASQVELSGFVRVRNGLSTDLQRSVSLDAMQDAARQVGHMIATTPLAALSGHAIQDIETWDDGDENAALAIAGRLVAGTSGVDGLGDDAQIVAGLTLASLQRPAAYANASLSAAKALDSSYASDPIWSTTQRDRLLMKFSRTFAKAREDVDPYAEKIIDYNPLDDDQTYVNELGVTMVVRHAISPIAWPPSMKPEIDGRFTYMGSDAELPHADVVLITWTSAEANAMAAVLSPGVWAMPPKNDAGKSWHEYTNQWNSKFRGRSFGRAPAASSHYIGKYLPIRTAGGQRVLLFKSNFHLARDDKSMPVKDMFKQVIEQTRAKLVITTGTAGPIGSKLQLGDVVVARQARFHCGRMFKNAPFNKAKSKPYSSNHQVSKNDHLKIVNESLVQANGARIWEEYQSLIERYPSDSLRGRIKNHMPRIFTDKAQIGEPPIILTTDEFEFDDQKHYFGLESLGSMVEMDDAVLGLAIDEMRSSAKWLAIRNASDPQMPSVTRTTLKKREDVASDIYMRLGYWTSIPSVLASWATALDFLV